MCCTAKTDAFHRCNIEKVSYMSTVTLIGAGQMASALTFPLIENGHEVRLVGSPLGKFRKHM